MICSYLHLSFLQINFLYYWFCFTQHMPYVCFFCMYKVYYYLLNYHNNNIKHFADTPSNQKLLTPKQEVESEEPSPVPSVDSSAQLNSSDNINNNNTTSSTTPSTSTTSMSAPSGRQPVKRRARRRTASQSQDPAEQLTEMSVRGLNLFRYASINEGVYQCTECAKVDVQKTFKNKYSFQRHAFLYHEGHQRKVFPCPVCQKEFSRPDKMKNHMKTVHDCFMPKDCVFPMGFFLQP